MDIVKIIKIGSLICTVVGTVGGAWASSKENKNILENAVKKYLENNKM